MAEGYADGRRSTVDGKKRKVRGEFCAKQEGESAATTGCFVFFVVVLYNIR